ncbi:MAG: hypothetical protein NVS2B12_18600 [Ktedonobacteraceae bacterium]
MRCQTCGVPLPSGVKVCPNCGTAVPVPDGTVIDTPGREPSIPPTIYGGPLPSVPGYDPAIQNPYDRPLQPPSPPYNNNQYQSSPYNQATPGQFSNQYAGGNVPPVYPPPGYMPPQQPRRKTRWGLIIGIIAGVLILACIGTSVVVGGLYSVGKNALNADTTATATARTDTAATPVSNTNQVTNTTPTAVDTAPGTTSTGVSPSGTPIDPDAATIVINAQSASGIDENTAAPKNLTSTFKTGDIVYVTFKLNSAKIDLTTQKIYVTAKLYIDKQLAAKFDPITFDKPSTGGYFSGTYKVASKGAMEIYLCSKSDCSDEKLAQVVEYTIVQA